MNIYRGLCVALTLAACAGPAPSSPGETGGVPASRFDVAPSSGAPVDDALAPGAEGDSAGESIAARALAAGESAPAPASAEEPAPESAPLSAECQRFLERLEKLREGIPFLFVDVQRSFDEIDRDIQESIELGDRFLGECGESDEAPLVMAHLGRHRLARFARHLDEVANETREAVKQAGLPRDAAEAEVAAAVGATRNAEITRMRELAEGALARAKPGSETRFLALMLDADTCEKSGDFARQAEVSRKIIEEYPTSEFVSKARGDVGKAYLYSGRYQDLVDWMKPIVDEHWSEDEVVLYVSLLFDGLTGIGDLEGMRALMERVQRDFPARAAKTKSDHYRDQFQQWRDVSDFWIGFVEYALGDADAARRAFSRAKDHLEARRDELAKVGQSLPAVQKIYYEMRVLDVLPFLSTHHGKIPSVAEYCATRLEAADLSDGVHWVAGEKTTLPELQGKVVAMIFRIPKQKLRGVTFLQEVDAMGRESPDVHSIWLSFGQPGAAVQNEQRYERMRAELEEYDLELSAGFDLSEGQCVFRSLHATVGTASFIALDKAGRIAWYLPDVRDMDRQILRRVIRRLQGK